MQIYLNKLLSPVSFDFIEKEYTFCHISSMAYRKFTFYHPLFWVVALVRIISALYILVNPLWGFFWSLFFDYFDAFVWMHMLGMTRKIYYRIDKIFDWIAYITMFIVGIQYGYEWILLPFLVYRFIGQFLNYLLGDGKLFVFFPNLFEAVFLWLIVGRRFGFNLFSPDYLKWLFILFIIKEIQEFWIYHIWPAHLHRHGYPKILKIFGQQKKVTWE